MNIQLLNKIAAVGTDKLDKSLYTVGADVQNPDATTWSLARSLRLLHAQAQA